MRYTGTRRGREAAKITGDYVGGTGKYAGLTGSFETARTPVRATMDGTSHSVTKGSFTYRLP
jgi:hypothetical protein